MGDIEGRGLLAMASANICDKILEQYQARKRVYDEFTSELVGLIGKLLDRSSTVVHSVSGRVKNYDSLRQKIARPEKAYASIDDIADIAGIRIIAYFSDQVDEIANLIRQEFEVDIHRSVDKRLFLDPDRFGYLSLHYVVGINSVRLQLGEYAKFNGYKAEVQIRSILQHSWAEIEHDLDYKSALAVPREIRRDFSRVAGLLELADSEFVRIKKSLEEYKRTVGYKINESPAHVSIDQVSLIYFAESSELVSSIDHDMAEASLVKGITTDASWLETYVDRLYYLGITTISELETALRIHRRFLVDYARERLRAKEYGVLLVGVSISYLLYALAGRRLKERDIIDYFEEFSLYSNYAEPEKVREEVAALVVTLLRKQLRIEPAGKSANPSAAPDG